MSVALAPDANPVRSASAFREGRVVQIRYTDFAQVKFRFHTMFGPSPEEAVQQLLADVGLQARHVRVRSLDAGDVAVLRRISQESPLHLEPGSVQPIAFVDGLTEAELASALAAIAAQAPAFI